MIRPSWLLISTRSRRCVTSTWPYLKLKDLIVKTSTRGSAYLHILEQTIDLHVGISRILGAFTRAEPQKFLHAWLEPVSNTFLNG